MQHRRLISIFLIICLCACGSLPYASAASASLLADNFDTYLSGAGTPPSGWSVNASDTNADYDIYSIATDRGRSVGLTQYASTTQVQFNRNFSGPSGETYAFEISIKRNALLSDFTLALRTNGTPASFSIELFSNGSIKTMGDAVTNFTYTAGEWLDLKLVFMPDIAKYTFIASQGDNYIAKTANLSGAPAIRDFRFYFPAGTHTDGNTILFDDVNVYTCDDIVIPKTDTDEASFAQVSSLPKNGETGVAAGSSVKVWFNETIATSDMTDVWSLNGESVDAGRITLSEDGMCAVVNLDGLLALDTPYTLSYTDLINDDSEKLSGSVGFTTAQGEFSLADVNFAYDADADAFTMQLGGRSNTAESRNIKACFAFHDDATGALKGLEIKDLTLGNSWAESAVTVAVPTGATVGEIYFWDNMHDMNVKAGKITFLGEGVASSSYSGSKELEYTIDYAQSKLTLSGTGAQDMASITLLKPEHTSDELSGDNEAAAAAIEYVSQTQCDESGAFSVSHVLTGGEGEYTVLVNRHDGNGVKEYANFVFYMTQESIDAAVGDYNADDADYAALIEQTKRAFNLDLTHYNALAPLSGGKDKVHAALKDGRPYTLPDQIRSVIEKNALLQALNEAESAAEFGGLLWENISLLEIDKAEGYTIYTDYSERIKPELSEALFADDYENLEELIKAFGDNTILCAVAAGELYTETKTVLEESFEYLGWDLTRYNEVKQVKNIFSSIKGKTYKTLDDLYDAFDDAVRDQLKEESESKKKSSSGGGGGGGSSSGKTVTLSEPQAPQQNETPNYDTPLENKIEFTDMNSHAWALEAVNALAEKEILNGKESGKFYPADALKREEMVKLIVCAFESVLSNGGEGVEFVDADNEAWYMPYIDKAYANGIVNGVGNGLFGIGAEITRQDLAVMCVRAAELAGIEFSAVEAPDFTDAHMISAYALEAAAKLYNAGIMIGDEGGAFRPKDMATRAEAAKILYMILQKGRMI